MPKHGPRTDWAPSHCSFCGRRIWKTKESYQANMNDLTGEGTSKCSDCIHSRK